uniref:Uncharacterized protein n=1 Tax=Dermatophagoides pteronyssinus TaxID=6956 RepID=A0A6P6Y8G5_DERPT|nr:putative uncharacterized protein DDB_G0279653 [Dermatophagoides pteronyssinus]
MNNDDNDICPELEYSTELIHFIHYHKCDPEREQLEQELEQKQDRDQDQDQEQEQDQDQNQDQDKDQDQNQEQDQDQDQDQDQKLEHKHEPDPLLEKILKSSDIDIHNKDIRIKNVSESSSYSAKRKSIIGSKDLRFCDDTVEQTIQLSQDFRHEKCTGDNLCLQIRNNLNYFLKMSTEECMDDNLNYEEFSKEIQRNSCSPSNLFSPSTSTTYMRNICEELTFFYTLLDYKYFHDCIKKWRKDLFID